MAVEHIPVLADTLAEQVTLPPDAVMVDATVGHGGHSYLFGRSLSHNATIIGLDVDQNSIEQARQTLAPLPCRIILIQANFATMTDQLAKLGIPNIDFLLADLGVSSAQLTDPETGLSFQANMPLDMRLDKSLKTTAADIVNRADEESLANIIYRYGQDRASRRIARFIVDSRKAQPITTTSQLATIVCKALGQPPTRRRSRIHPATRTFQALRIAVNNELENLEKLLESAPAILKKGGKIAVISFHSLEDGLVKANFRKKKENGTYRIVTKKPIVATRKEIQDNPRARSAKLRIAERL
jgi:16S rRNA (cytosine1402-N4)-methyltransferase